tara:strand:+ start:5495 stop:7111 length:1617 start_codon:yes stop_codon:yes gene_type:complete
MFKQTSTNNLIFDTKATIIYPIIGLIFFGNLLIIANFFVELENNFLYVFLILLLIPNFIGNNKVIFKISNVLTFENIFLYIFIPGILLISSSDINFHYDAAYYHLNHQNWLRSSNLIIGSVNIFWPFGMSSIYEYISSMLWSNNSLIYLHFLNLIFLQFLFSFIFYHLFNSTNKNFKFTSIFLVLFSIFDNFGIAGGRNGFVYIQEIGKQDTTVAILFCITSILILDKIQKRHASKIDIVLISLLVFFIFEIKVSGVIIFILYFILIFTLIRNNKYSFRNLIYLQSPTIFFGLIWSLKSIMTTGCLIFPLSFTCYESFWWYEIGSTERVEAYTTATSFSFMEYFLNDNLNFLDWVNYFLFSETNSTFSNYYLSVYSNFLISFVILLFIKYFLFNKKVLDKRFKLILLAYITLSIVYLIFYGPIPRYSMGILITVICSIGFFVDSEKVKISKYVFYSLFIMSIGLLPRAASYENFIENKEIALFDPRIESQYIEVQINENWIKPASGDRCWINLKCTMENKIVNIVQSNYFKFAYKENT